MIVGLQGLDKLLSFYIKFELNKWRHIKEDIEMDDILKFCEQMALLNQLKNKKLITMIEYDKIKLYIKKKYKIGVYAMEL